MKIIFLDFDGVLNSRKWSGNFRDELDPEAVERVNKITRAVSDTKIVISSTWRILHKLEWLKDLLKRFGLEAEVIGVTPGAQAQTPSGILLANGRGEEIKSWLKVNEKLNIEQFVALDDSVFDMKPIGDHLIKTTFEGGLLDHHVEEAITKLNSAVAQR